MQREARFDSGRNAATVAGLRDFRTARKKKYRTFADLASIYGVDLDRIEKRNPEKYLGLWLNRGRELCRQSISVRYGVRHALNSLLGPMPPKFYSEVAENEQQAIFLRECDSES